MSNVLGEPNLTPSNTSGRSAVGAEQIGHLGYGVLQTIEEGEGAFNPAPFYYSKDVAYYQLPSLQRSHNDDKRSIAIRQFNSRGTVTLTRRWMNMGPALLHLELPIEYAWAGCEYRHVSFCETASNVAEGASTNPEILSSNQKERFIEVPGCSTILPTSFQSEGFGFATMNTIELDLGGGGRITFDRYSNFAAIMASCPFIETRKRLMRMAGGGLDLSTEEDISTAPVKWGWVTDHNACGNTQDIRSFSVAGTLQTSAVDKKRYVPTSWDILVPIKTPETNFMMGLVKRKPLDTLCLAGDIQYTFSWANFFEYSDTGVGYPNAPYYRPFGINNSVKPVYITVAGGPTYSYTSQYILPYCENIAKDFTAGVGKGGLGAAYLQSVLSSLTVPYTDANANQLKLENIVAGCPQVWTNHYRVAAGRSLNVQDFQADTAKFVSFTGLTDTTKYAGRPCFPRVLNLGASTDGTVRKFKSNQEAADVVNTIASISYPTGFTNAELINSSLKLTNPSLGAYNSLRVDRNAVLYYPFNYFYQQVYRITTNPFANILHWTDNNIDSESTRSDRLLSDQNKITQLIQMPANPTTSMIIGIYREKDRKFLGKNVQNSYSPVLFWNAIAPERMTLWDGGNILFDYISKVDYEMYSMIDRPDPIFIPFKGGCVKVQRKAMYSDSGTGDMTSSGFNNAKDCLFRTTVPPSVATSEVDYAAVSKTAPDITCAGAYPFDSREMMKAHSVGAGCLLPHHLTENYEAVLMEFPFVMHEPITHENLVQSTPSFAKTQLKLDFWINPKLKPDSGLDDQYDRTYGITRGAASGMLQLDGTETSYAKYLFPNAASLCVPDSQLAVNPEHPFLRIRDKMAVGSLLSGVTATCAQGTYNNAFDFTTCNSWNINNGSLMLHVTFCQNQVWTMSPLHTSILSSRG